MKLKEYKFHPGLLIRTSITILILLQYTLMSDVKAQLELDIETGVVFSGYNDVQIPNETGTRISLSDELETEPNFFSRARVIYNINEKHTIAVLVAPLRLQAEGRLNKIVKFQDEEFPANTLLKSTYRFDSYRLTYRYNFSPAKNLEAGLGFTAKIRDASISLKANSQEAEKKNTGFVPLVNFRAEWFFDDDFSLVLEGDALAAPQGRAEDVLLAIEHQLEQNVKLKLGYRILEGGADSDEVYTFALLHYAVVGMIVRF